MPLHLRWRPGKVKWARTLTSDRSTTIPRTSATLPESPLQSRAWAEVDHTCWVRKHPQPLEECAVSSLPLHCTCSTKRRRPRGGDQSRTTLNLASHEVFSLCEELVQAAVDIRYPNGSRGATWPTMPAHARVCNDAFAGGVMFAPQWEGAPHCGGSIELEVTL